MSAIIVPVDLPPELERFRLEHVETAPGVPAHVSLLYPFVAVEDLDRAVIASLASIARGHRPFRFRLTGVARWPSIVYLTVDPAVPFEALVGSLGSVFPAYPPNGGLYPFVPHVTLAEDGVSVPPGLEPAVEVLGRRAFDASELVVIARKPEGWQLRAAFPLGPARRTERSVASRS